MTNIKTKLFYSIAILLFNFKLVAQTKILIYPDSVLGKSISEDKLPGLEIYSPDKTVASKTSILIIPGGGYSSLAYKEEGIDIAKAFAKAGITSFVLKYRLPSKVAIKDRSIAPLQDGQQAIKLIRAKAKEWNLYPNKLGVIGFSAGGHLASTLGTKFQKSFISNPEKKSLRPDFMILVYPVISMEDKLAHQGSRLNLLGQHPTENQIWTFSSDKQVSFDTPPTYFTHTGDDQIVNVNNSIEMYKALVNNNVPAEMHLFPKGNHGFIQRLPVNEWLDPMLTWLQKGGFYTKPVSK